MFPDDQATAAAERERDRAQREMIKAKKALQKYKEAVERNGFSTPPACTLTQDPRNLR